MIAQLLNAIDDIVSSLRPPKPGDDVEAWRRSVFGALVLILVYSAFHAIWALGWMATIGYAGPYADIEQIRKDVDRKIETAIKPLQEKIDSTYTTSNAILRALYLPQIRAKVRERCDTAEADKRAAINQELDRIKEEYKHFAGAEFGPDPRCDQV